MQVGVVLLNESMPGSTVGAGVGDGVADFVGVGVGFGVGFGVDFAGGAVVLVAGLAGDGVAVTVSVAVAVTMVAGGGAGVVAGAATTTDAESTAALAGALVAGAAEDGVIGPAGGLDDVVDAWWEPDEHADSRRLIDTPATSA